MAISLVCSDEWYQVRKITNLDEGFRIKIDDDDDLWTLSQICSRGSYVGMLSHRRDSTTGTQENSRAKGAERKPMWIVLEVQSSSFHSFTENLRVHGVISDAKIDIGNHHTHIIVSGSEIEISRDGGLSEADISLLEKSFSSGKNIKSGLIVVENDEILIFEITQYGMRDISQFSMRGGGKRYSDTTSIRNNFFSKTAQEVILLFEENIPLIICGPGLARDNFEKIIRKLGANNEIINSPSSIGGRSAANEILTDGLADSIIGKNALIRQIRTIEEGLKRISTNGNVCFGQKQIIEAAKQGAIEKLVILATLIRSEDNDNNSVWSSIIEDIKISKGELIQSSSDHDFGEQLSSFGGAIALLRWKLE